MSKPIWDKVLATGEKVEYEFTLGDRYRIVPIVLWGVILLPWMIYSLANGKWLVFVLYGLLAFYLGFYVKRAYNYAITDRRVIYHHGWLSTKITSLNYSKITEIVATEPFFEKLFYKTGKLEIHTSGSDATKMTINHVAQPYEIKKKISHLVETAK